MGVALCAGAAAILAFAGASNLHLQRAQLTRLVGLSADRIADIIRRSTREAMLRDDREGLHRMIRTIGSEPGIRRIRILNKQGAIRTSTDASEVGRQVDIRAEQCHACHRADQPLDHLDGKDRIRTFRDGAGERVLGIIAPIRNEAACSGSCHAHPAAQRVLGVLDVQLSLAAVDDALADSERQMTGGLAATVGAVLVLAGLLVWRMVLQPVERLRAAMARVAAGDYASTIPARGADELGAMADAWNAMTADLRRARQSLEESNRTLEARVAEKTAALTDAHHRVLRIEKMASLGKLAAVMAHEINNPLTGIRTFARLLRRRLGPDPRGESARALETIDREAGRCGDIVRDLLLFSRASAARLAEEDLGPVVDRARTLLRHQAELLGVTLETALQPGLPRVVCDAAQIEQLVLALAQNAVEATPPGGRVRIEVRTGEGSEVRIGVSDTGGGIPPAVADRLYEPFFTTKPEGRGLGLGLAVVHGIVERHHGHIDFASSPSGTTFTVSLPAGGPEAAVAS
jgi:two-component system NtrC family sensor kinase